MRRLAFALAACLGAAGAARAELNQGRLGDAHPVVGRRRGVALGRCSTSRAAAASATRTPFAGPVFNLLSLSGGATDSPLEVRSFSGSIPLPIVKILLQLALTGFNVACWMIPLRSKSFAQNKNVLSIANAFSAGIFLMLGLGHLVPHSLEALDSISANRNLTFYALLGGYLMMLLIEKVAFNSHALLHSLECPGVVSHDHSHAHPEHAIKVSTSLPVADSPPQLPETCTLEHDHSLHTHDKTLDNQLRPGGGTLSPTSAIVLLVAMSAHSLFETLALGIAQDRLSATMMAISIGLHQPAESVALLVAFLKTSLPIEAIVKWLGLFSAVGMLGVCLGLLISKVASPFVDAILVAITAGTFLYVGATEICNEEFEEGSLREKLTRFAALIGGISVIAIITGVTEKFEGHHHTTHGHDHVQ